MAEERVPPIQLAFKWKMPKREEGSRPEPYITVMQDYFKEEPYCSLSIHASHLFLAILAFTDKARIRWNPNRSRLMKYARIGSSHTYGNAIQELVDAGLIRKIRNGRLQGYEVYPSVLQAFGAKEWVNLHIEAEAESSEGVHECKQDVQNCTSTNAHGNSARAESPNRRDTYVSNGLKEVEPSVQHDGVGVLVFDQPQGLRAAGAEAKDVVAAVAAGSAGFAVGGSDHGHPVPSSLPLAGEGAGGPSVLEPEEAARREAIDLSSGYPAEFGNEYPESWWDMSNEQRMRFNICYYDPSNSVVRTGLFKPANRKLVLGRVELPDRVVTQLTACDPKWAEDMQALRVQEMLCMAYHYFNKTRLECPVQKPPHEPAPRLAVKVTDTLSQLTRAQNIFASRYPNNQNDYPFNLVCKQFFEWMRDNKPHKSWTWNMMPMLANDWMTDLVHIT